MRMIELIEKKRDGLALTREEINFIVQGYVRDEIPDYQVSALTMAIYFRGMNSEETADLTLAMANSGEQVDLSLLGEFTVDKHSSGGVGDKTTLIVGPLVAACGLPVAKMSGRGLGHTGGTIDKLSSIPGFRVELEQKEFIQQVKDIGISVIAQTGNIVPADKKLYALRDVTATVDSIPLIASSIMSKKIAAGARGIVLDVKYGSGAFMSTVQEAQQLARTMVDIGGKLGRKTFAVLSSMEEPLGRAVGNSIEVLEALDVLQGKGPADLRQVCLELACWMLVAGNKAASPEAAKTMLTEVLASGKAWAKFLEFISAQGGDVEILRKGELPLAPVQKELKAEKGGYVQKIDARKVGNAAMVLGAGRATKESRIDYGAGLYLHAKSGDYVQEGQTLITLYTSDSESIQPAFMLLTEALSLGADPVLSSPLISAVIS